MKVTKQLFAFILTFLIFASSVPAICFNASAAAAPPYTGTVYIQNVASGHYLSVAANKDSDGANIKITKYAKDEVRQVIKIKKSGSLYLLQTANSTTRAISVASTVKSGANVCINPNKNANSGLWEFYKNSDGTYSIRSAANTKLALNAQGKATSSNVGVKTYSSTDSYQKWKITPFSLKKDADSPYNKAYGIDVSHWQGDINWQAVKEYGVQFAIISVGHSATYKDEKFEENYKQAKANGIKVGAYIYSDASTVPKAEQEAAAVIKTIKGKTFDYPVFFDLEDPSIEKTTTKTEKTNMCLAFIKAMNKAGYKSGVYASEYWFNDLVFRDKIEEVGTTWVAQWPKSDTADVDHSDYSFWQYRSDGFVAGISGKIDMDVMYEATKTYDYRGSAIKPYSYKIYNGQKLLTRNTDYTLSYINNINAGMGKVTVNGKGSYAGKTLTTRKFYILPLNINTLTLSGFVSSVIFAGSAVKQDFTLKNASGTVLKESIDYTVKYTNNKAVGTAKLEITGKGNYCGTITKTYNICESSITNATVSGIKNMPYSGSSVYQNEVTVKIGNTVLVHNTDYKFIYANNVNIGTANITIVGIGIYSGTIKKTFKITPKPISGVTVNNIADVGFLSSGAKPKEITVTDGELPLKENTDYFLTYSNNTCVGTASVIINGKGNYSGTLSKTYKIVPANINSAKITAISWFDKNSNPQTQVTVNYGGAKLKEGVDFTVKDNHDSYSKTSIPIVSGIGNYCGIGSVQAEIKSANISTMASISGYGTSHTYSGKAFTQSIKVILNGKTLKNGTDYTVSYKNNTNAGKATVTVTGIGQYTGTAEKSFTIKQKSLTKATVSGIKNKTYTGSTVTQSPKIVVNKITLKKNKDYTLTYSNAVKNGTAKLTIKGIGNYYGSIKKSFTVNKAKISKIQVKNFKSTLSYNKKYQTQPVTLVYKGITLKQNKDYTLKYYNNKYIGKATLKITGKGNFKSTLTKTFKILPKPPKITKASAKDKAIKITFTKTKFVGVEIYYSESKSFKKQMVYTLIGKNTSFTIYNLESNKKYYIRLRAFDIDGTKFVYSNYSNVVTKTAK